MASITDTGHGAARWILEALRRRLRPVPCVAEKTETVATRHSLRPRRYYPQQRNQFIEHAAMAREMYRL
jgi:hypothetical protein